MRSRGIILGVIGAITLIALSIVGALWTLLSVTLIDPPTIALFIITIICIGMGGFFGIRGGLRPSTPYW